MIRDVKSSPTKAANASKAPVSANPKQNSAPTNRANPILETLSTIRGYPDRLKIFQIPASPYWWVRATFGEKRIKRSTHETDRPKAIVFAKNFYEELLRNNGSVPLTTSKSFQRCAQALLEEHRRKMTSGERNPRFADDLRKQLTHRILPFFKNYALKDINYTVLSGFVNSMRKADCSASTIQRNLVSVRQILKHAIKLDLLESLPIFPAVSHKDNPRPWFNEDDYKLLKETAAIMVKEGYTYKGEAMTEEVRDFILFMVNTFLRPSDWYQLKRNQIRVQKRKDGEEPILVISPSTSKTVNTQIISMPTAVHVYENIINRQNQSREWSENSYVFFPHIESRGKAKNLMRVFFDQILRKAGLKTAHTGNERTIYSLRHTAIAFRLLKGENVDLLFLARNCRTSVDMIDRFYCRHLNALMAPEKIVGMRNQK